MQALLKSTSAWKLPQIARAVEVKLGATGPGDVSLRFEGLADAVRTGLETRFTSCSEARGFGEADRRWPTPAQALLR